MTANVLITGVSRRPGIGAALAVRLASADFNRKLNKKVNNDVFFD